MYGKKQAFDTERCWQYNSGMKKLFIGFIVISILTITGCGVKSDLVRPDKSFPRDYPVY